MQKNYLFAGASSAVAQSVLQMLLAEGHRVVEKSSWMTGTILPVDGGMSSLRML